MEKKKPKPPKPPKPPKHLLLVDEGTDVIAGYVHASSTSMEGHRVVDVTAQPISGDSLPLQLKKMTGGKITTDFVRTPRGKGAQARHGAGYIHQTRTPTVLLVVWLHDYRTRLPPPN